AGPHVLEDNAVRAGDLLLLRGVPIPHPELVSPRFELIDEPPEPAETVRTAEAQLPILPEQVRVDVERSAVRGLDERAIGLSDWQSLPSRVPATKGLAVGPKHVRKQRIEPREALRPVRLVGDSQTQLDGNPPAGLVLRDRPDTIREQDFEAYTVFFRCTFRSAFLPDHFDLEFIAGDVTDANAQAVGSWNIHGIITMAQITIRTGLGQVDPL